MTAARRSSRRTASRGRRRGGWPIVAALVLAGSGFAAWWAWTSPAQRIAPPLDEHDEASRARLEAVLREADREERGR